MKVIDNVLCIDHIWPMSKEKNTTDHIQINIWNGCWIECARGEGNAWIVGAWTKGKLHFKTLWLINNAWTFNDALFSHCIWCIWWRWTVGPLANDAKLSARVVPVTLRWWEPGIESEYDHKQLSVAQYQPSLNSQNKTPWWNRQHLMIVQCKSNVGGRQLIIIQGGGGGCRTLIADWSQNQSAQKTTSTEGPSSACLHACCPFLCPHQISDHVHYNGRNVHKPPFPLHHHHHHSRPLLSPEWT